MLIPSQFQLRVTGVVCSDVYVRAFSPVFAFFPVWWRQKNTGALLALVVRENGCDGTRLEARGSPGLCAAALAPSRLLHS